MKNRSRSGGLPDFLRLACARVRPPIREQGTGKGTGSMEQGINSPPIPTTTTSTRETTPVDGQPPCTCQCHPKYGNPFDECCKTGHPIDGSLGAVPFDAEGGDSPLDELFRFADELRDGDVYRIPIVGESIIPALPRVHAPYPSQVTAAARERGLARLRFAIAWCGPWERLEARFLAIDTGTLDLRRIIRDGTWRERLAAWCGSRDLEWQRRHVETGTTPNRRWRRKAGH